MKTKLSKNEKILENTVLAISQKHSPSRIRRLNDKSFVKRYERNLFDLFQNRLKFPLTMFNNAKVLEFGSGTGEKSILFSKHGAHLTCVEFNDKSIKRHKELIQKFAIPQKKIKFFNCSIYDFKNQKDNKFDICISLGVLPHVADPKMAFGKLTKLLKKGGFCIIGVLNTLGNLHINLQRYSLYRLTDKTHKSIPYLAEFLFKDYIDRMEKYGGRFRASIISDTYINPKVSSVRTSEILDWFRKNNIVFYSSWPPIVPEYFADSSSRKYIDFSNMKNQHFLSRFETKWAMSTEDDIKKLDNDNKIFSKFDSELDKFCNKIKDVSPTITSIDKTLPILEKLSIHSNKINDDWNLNLKILISEIQNFIKLIESEKPDLIKIKARINKNKILFSKNAGIPTTFYAGYKKS